MFLVYHTSPICSFPIGRILCQPPDIAEDLIIHRNNSRSFLSKLPSTMPHIRVKVKQMGGQLSCNTATIMMYDKLALLLFYISYVYSISEISEETCETLPSDINLIKEEFDELGRLQRTCNGEVAVNKCEGSCKSQVQPSVITPTGFLKECYCCRESFLRERIITLTHCYDPDGVRLTTEGVNSMDVKLREPAECKCYKCGDFSR